MGFSLPGFGKASVIGLDIGSSSVKAVEILQKSRDKGFELRSLGQAALPSEAIVQGAFLNSTAIVDTIREAVDAGKIKTTDVAAAVSGHSVIVKRVNLPSMSREELENQIQWEAEQYIPFDVNEVNLDFQILANHEHEGQMDVLLVAAKKADRDGTTGDLYVEINISSPKSLTEAERSAWLKLRNLHQDGES